MQTVFDLRGENGQNFLDDQGEYDAVVLIAIYNPPMENQEFQQALGRRRGQTSLVLNHSQETWANRLSRTRAKYLFVFRRDDSVSNNRQPQRRPRLLEEVEVAYEVTEPRHVLADDRRLGAGAGGHGAIFREPMRRINAPALGGKGASLRSARDRVVLRARARPCRVARSRALRRDLSA